ncbi:hypothetical protein P9112_001925 [Eukaryota sp. TZLM1-RC]
MSLSPVRLPSASLPSSSSPLPTSSKHAHTPSRHRSAFNQPQSPSASVSVLQGTITKLKESNRSLLSDLQREREQHRLASDSPASVDAVRKKYEQVIFKIRSQLDNTKAEVNAYKSQIGQLNTEKKDLARQVESFRSNELKLTKRINKLESVLARARSALHTSLTSNELLHQLKMELEEDQVGIVAESNRFAEKASLHGHEVQRLLAENTALKKQLDATNAEMAAQTQQFLQERESFSLELSELRRHVEGDSVISELRIGSENKRKGLSSLIKNLQDRGRNQTSMLEEFLTRVMSGGDVESSLLEYCSDIVAESRTLKIELSQCKKELAQLKGGSLEGGFVRSSSVILEEKLAKVEKQLKESQSEVFGLQKVIGNVASSIESIFVKLGDSRTVSSDLESSLQELDGKVTAMVSNVNQREGKRKGRESTRRSGMVFNQSKSVSQSNSSFQPDLIDSGRFNDEVSDSFMPTKEMKALSLAFVKKRSESG